MVAQAPALVELTVVEERRRPYLAPDEPVPWARVLSEVVAPVVEVMFTGGELVKVETWLSKEREVQLCLTITTGEVSGHYLSLWIATAAEIREQLASEIQDFLAESRHAWGELRTYPPFDG